MVNKLQKGVLMDNIDTIAEDLLDEMVMVDLVKSKKT